MKEYNAEEYQELVCGALDAYRDVLEILKHLSKSNDKVLEIWNYLELDGKTDDELLKEWLFMGKYNKKRNEKGSFLTPGEIEDIYNKIHKTNG